MEEAGGDDGPQNGRGGAPGGGGGGSVKPKKKHKNFRLSTIQRKLNYVTVRARGQGAGPGAGSGGAGVSDTSPTRGRISPRADAGPDIELPADTAELKWYPLTAIIMFFSLTSLIFIFMVMDPSSCSLPRLLCVRPYSPAPGASHVIMRSLLLLSLKNRS